MNKAMSIAVMVFAHAVVGAIVMSFAFDWKLGVAYYCAVKALSPVVKE